MNDSYCIILIHEFPYYNGETFFDSELRNLSVCFKKIFIFSVLGKSGIAYNRNIPDNVEIIPLEISSNAFINLFYGITANYIKKEKLFKGSFKYKLFSTYCRGRLNRSYRRIRKWLSTNKIEFSNKNVVIYSYWLNLSFLCSTIKKDLEGYCNNIKTITRAHGYDIYSERKNFAYLPYQLEGIEAIDEIYTCSHKGAHYLINKYPKYKEKIYNEYLGVEQNRYFYNHNRKVFATCSVMRPIKQTDLFARAFCLFLKNHPDYIWVCIGGGPDYDKVYSIVANNNCLNRVIFTKSLTNKEVIDCLIDNKVGYFFNVSKDEGLPVTLMEAQSLGIPCIATNVGGSSEIVNNNNGILIPPVSKPDDIMSIYLKLDCIELNEYKKMSTKSFENWNANFNAAKNYKTWAEKLSKF